MRSKPTAFNRGALHIVSERRKNGMEAVFEVYAAGGGVKDGPPGQDLFHFAGGPQGNWNPGLAGLLF
jgi:hypothetical protein